MFIEKAGGQGDVRRASPRPWDTDWLMLRELSAVLVAEIEKHIAPGSELLDFGCGSMPYRHLVIAQGIRYQGADFSGHADVRISADGRLPLPDGSIDAVLSVQVLEHVRDLDLYLSEAARVLTDDGLILLSTHGTWLYHPHPEDHRRWTRTGLAEDLERRGFAVEKLYGITGPLATTTLIRLTGFAYVLRKFPVIGRLLANGLAVAMNARAWLEDRLTPAEMRRDNSCVYFVRCSKRLDRCDMRRKTAA